MTPDPLDRIRAVKDIPALIAFLRDELDWPIEADDFDELTFDYEPEELGIDARTAARIEEIKQLRPLVSNQPPVPGTPPGTPPNWLAPALGIKGAKMESRWRVFVNAKVEPDL